MSWWDALGQDYLSSEKWKKLFVFQIRSLREHVQQKQQKMGTK